MIHPSKLAENYIYQKFCEAHLDENSQEISEEIIKIVQRIEHRPIIPESESYRKHLLQTIQIIDKFELKLLKLNYPSISLQREKDQTNRMLKTWSNPLENDGVQ